MTESDLRPHAYVLAVHDLAGSAEYFVKVLGFSVDWGDGDNWQALIRGEVRLMLGSVQTRFHRGNLAIIAISAFSPPATSMRCMPNSKREQHS